MLGCDYRTAKKWEAGGRFHCPITISVELANAADADKMPPGRLVTLYGRFELWRAKDLYFVIMKNAKVLYADPFGR